MIKILSSVCLLSSLAYTQEVSNGKLLEKIEQLERRLDAQKEAFTKKRNYGKLNISGDYRFSVDNLDYILANGSSATNDALLTNRLWLNFAYNPNRHLDFNTKIAFNKVFGHPAVLAPNGKAPFDSFDWIASSTNTDDGLRVKNAYINYREDTLFGLNIPWKFGVGRRPTSYTQLLSLRDDQAANSPLGHLVSSEFDGGSIAFKLSNITDISGMKVKFGTGRAISYVTPSLSATPNVEWGKNINMLNINFVPYSIDNLHTELQAIKITNLVDIVNSGYAQDGSFNPDNFNPALETLGDIYLANFMVKYSVPSLNHAIFFASVAMSQTDPDSNKQMFNSSKSEIGTSYWIGTQWIPTFIKDSKIGVEYNHGSKYWRSFTYGEDTVSGSKIATRGDAYELYFTKELMKGLSFQARYTYLDYDYTGSDGFVGSQTGSPMKISDIKKYFSNTAIASSAVDKSQDFRFYLRYRF